MRWTWKTSTLGRLPATHPAFGFPPTAPSLLNRSPLPLLSSLRFSIQLAFLFLLAAQLPLTQQIHSQPLPPDNPDASEKILFDAGIQAFQDGFYEQARQTFVEWLERYPDSPKAQQVSLLQLQARAEAELSRGDYQNASNSFSELIALYPSDSTQRLNAIMGESLARFYLGELNRTVELLDPMKNIPPAATQSIHDVERLVRGHLLLAETLLDLQDFSKAEDTLRHMGNFPLTPELNWQRQYLFTRIQMEDQRLEEAWNTAQALPSLAQSSVQSQEYFSQSIALQVEILQQRGMLATARKTLEQNLTPSTTPRHQRLALLKLASLWNEEHQPAKAIPHLENYLTRYTEDPKRDLVTLSLGEMWLRDYYLAPATNQLAALTNNLPKAKALFQKVLKDYPDSPLLGETHLQLGWCLWEEGQATQDPKIITQAQESFHNAVEQSPPSKNHAIAQFKLADCQFFLKDFKSAIDSYWTVVNQYETSSLPEVVEQVIPQALYQIVQTGILQEDIAVATQALTRILNNYPQTLYNERGRLLLGKGLTRLKRPAQAQRFLSEFVEKFPKSPLLPEAKIALARAYEMDNQWSKAIALYEQWVVDYPYHPSLPLAEYYRALAYDYADTPSQSLKLFESYVNRYATNSLAPLAQNWIADFHFQHNDYVNAETHYQRLYQNPTWPTTELSYHARVMAGRSAFLRDGYRDARVYFTDVIKRYQDTNCPPSLIDEALFGLGDTIVQEPLTPEKTIKDKYQEAINAFRKIPPERTLYPKARGRMGGAYLQLAFEDPVYLNNAQSAFEESLNSPHASLSTRSLAEIGLATVARKRADLSTSRDQKNAFLQQSLTHYQNVFYGKNRRPEETIDEATVRQSADQMIELLQELGQWDQVISIYQRLLERYPTLKPRIEPLLQQAQRQISLTSISP